MKICFGILLNSTGHADIVQLYILILCLQVRKPLKFVYHLMTKALSGTDIIHEVEM